MNLTTTSATLKMRKRGTSFPRIKTTPCQDIPLHLQVKSWRGQRQHLFGAAVYTDPITFLPVASSQQRTSAVRILSNSISIAKLPLKANSSLESSNLSLYDCNANCSSDYSCVAFAYDDRTASCDVWSRGMNSKSHPIFYKETTQLYFMLADNSSELDKSIFLVVSLVLALGFLSTMFLLIVKELIRSKVDETEVEMRNKEGKTNQELQFFSLETIAHATNNFAATNKLGEGGFGPVYKGKLHSGQQIAVKRLSSSSGQELRVKK